MNVSNTSADMAAPGRRGRVVEGDAVSWGRQALESIICVGAVAACVPLYLSFFAKTTFVAPTLSRRGRCQLTHS